MYTVYVRGLGSWTFDDESTAYAYYWLIADSYVYRYVSLSDQSYKLSERFPAES